MLYVLVFLSFLTSVFSTESASIVNLENDPSTIVAGIVNIITGDLVAFEEDLVIQGKEPIRITRSTDLKAENFWQIFNTTSNVRRYNDDTVWIVSERNGSAIWYQKEANLSGQNQAQHRYNPTNLFEGFSNTSHKEISSRTNLKNHYILQDSWRERFAIHCADGTIRYYMADRYDSYHRLIEEKLPNGNWTIYEYEKKGKAKNPYYDLTSIRTTNPSKNKIYARADFVQKKTSENSDSLFIIGSDGQSVEYQFQRKITEFPYKSLTKVISSQNPDRKLEYVRYKPKLKKFKYLTSLSPQLRLGSLSSPLGRELKIDYYKNHEELVFNRIIDMKDHRKDILSDITLDMRRNRVKTLSAPIGFSSQITHSFIYDLNENRTSVFCIDGYLIDYSWNKDLRINKIEHYSNDRKKGNTEKFSWGNGVNIGNLISKTFIDAKGTTILSKSYIYDLRGNVLEEKLYGNFSGKGAAIGFDRNDLHQSGECKTEKFRYTTTEPNLLLEKQAESGLRVAYEYLKGTDLPIAELTFDKDQLKIRKFWEYNSDNILIREVVDDGSSPEKQNLIGVLTRTIRDFSLLEEGPYLGMPRVIEEKYWENGQEHLLKKTSLSYTTGSKIAQRDIYDSTGQFRYRISFSYDEKGRLKSQTNAMGQVETFSYDECGNQIESKDYSGRLTTEFVYDLSNRPILSKKSGTDTIAKSTTFTYDNKHHVTKESTQAGVDTLYAYDLFGRCKEIHFPDIDSTIRQEHDSSGNLVLKVDGEGNATRTTYNSYGKPVLVTHPDGAQEEYLYNLNGALKTHTDPLGVVTSYEYDYLGRVLAKTIANELQESFQYYGSHLIAKIDAMGNETTYTYDGAGRKIAEEFATEKTTYHYDALGRQHIVQKGDLYIICEYDLLDRVIEERKESNSGTLFQEVNYEYDEAGNKKTVLNYIAGGQAREESAFDSFRRLIHKKDPLGAVEKIIYKDDFKNKRGQTVLQKTHIDPLGLTSIQTYDTRDRLQLHEKKKENTIFIEEKKYNKNGKIIAQTNTIFAPDLSKRTIDTFWEYDACDRVKALIEPEGKITTYKYTLRGELAQLTKPCGKTLFYTYNDFGLNTALISSDRTVAHQMEYNRLGQLVATDQIRRTLDPHGKILKETFPLGYEIENQYDQLGRRTQCRIPTANCLICYEYNEAYIKQICRYTLDGQLLYKRTYTDRDLSGNLTLEQTPCGTISYTIDPLSRKTAIQAPFFNQEITNFDPVGNIRSMNVQQNALEFTYDDLYQLTSESGHTYAYDSLKNRLQKDGEEIQINSLNQDITHFEYNRNGNPIAQGNTTYSYDALDRIISLESPPLYQTYTYDFFNRCIFKTSSYKDTSNNRHFLYDGQNEIGALDENLNPIEFRLLGPTPHAEIGASIAIELQKSIYTPIHDLQGNIAVLIPHFSDQPTYYRYTAFGEEASSKPNPNPWRYSSKRSDDQTGLVYFGRRFYSPTHGRWLTPDPAGFTDGMNLYAYLHNDPLIHFDEYGLFTHGYRESGSQLSAYASQALQSTTMNILNNPRFQGSMQAFGGLAEAGIGGGMILANKGFSPLGWTVLAHGIDHFFTGLNRVSTGIPRDSSTSQLLQKTGIPRQMANGLDGSFSIFGPMKGAAILRSAQLTAFPQHYLPTPPNVLGGAYNCAAFEEYKITLRSQMGKPYVLDQRLQKIVNRNYRPNATIGNGSTAAAIRHETTTGGRLFEKLHSQKGNEMINALESWLKNNPAARPSDQAAAENIIKDLQNALGK